MSIAELIPETETPPEPRRFTVEEYLAMAEAGILKPKERVQLINGEIVRMSLMGELHKRVMAIVTALLTDKFAPLNAVVASQLPIEVKPDSMPEPDFIIYDRKFLGIDRFPEGKDLHLAVEVAVSSVRTDKGSKASLYARAGIPEYWIINLRTRTLEVHRQPDAAKESYAESFTRGIDEKVSVARFPEVEFLVGDFFGAKGPQEPQAKS